MNIKNISIQYSGELNKLISQVIADIKIKEKVLNLSISDVKGFLSIKEDNLIDRLLQLKQKPIKDENLLKLTSNGGSLGIMTAPHYYIDDVGCVRYNTGKCDKDYYVAVGKDDILYIIKPELVYVLKEDEDEDSISDQYVFVTSKKIINEDLRVKNQNIKDYLNGGMN